MNWLYAAYNLFILLPCLWISHTFKVGTHKRWRALISGYAMVSLPFIIWDVAATALGHWAFAKDYTFSIRVFGLPIEEIAFFFTVPFACMMVWDALGQVKGKVSQKLQLVLLCLITLGTVVLGLTNIGQGYTQLVTTAVLLTLACLVWLGRGLILQKRFWYFQAIIVGLFLIFNTFLTAIPIVTYGDVHNSGIRIGTIPLEDLFFNFALLNGFLLAYTRKR